MSYLEEVREKTAVREAVGVEMWEAGQLRSRR